MTPIPALCPKCHKPVRLVLIEPHPTRDDVAHHVFDCAKCGPVLTVVENRSEQTAEIIEIMLIRLPPIGV